MGVLIYKNDPRNPGVYRTTWNSNTGKVTGDFIE